MKTFKLFLVGILPVLLFACQSVVDVPDFEISDFEISNLGITKENAKLKLSHKPTGIVYEKTTGYSVKIEFGLSEWAAEYIKTSDGEISVMDTISTVGKLLSVYNAHRPFFQYSWSSLRYPPSQDSEYILPKLAYALAQECIQDHCSSQTRRAVLQIAVNKQEQIYSQEYVNNFVAGKTGVFLMAVILIKEKDASFITAIHDNPDLQKALSMNGDNSMVDKEFSNLVSQFALGFLLKLKV
jgi:hypothetical protein